MVPDPVPPDFSPRQMSQLLPIATALLVKVEEGSEEALHDLALLRMASAEDERSSGVGWQRALETWHEVGKSDAYWLRVSVRAGFLDDPRVTEALVSQLRQNFIDSAMERFGTVARGLIAEGKDDDAIRVYKVALASPSGSAASAAVAPALATLGTQLSSLLDSHGIGAIDNDQLVAVWQGDGRRVAQLGVRCKQWLTADRELAVPLDASAHWLRALAVRLHNDLMLTDLAAEAAAKGRDLAVSEDAVASTIQACQQLDFMLQRDHALRAAEAGQWSLALAHAKAALPLAPAAELAQLTAFIATCEARIASGHQLSLEVTSETGTRAATGVAEPPVRTERRRWPWVVAAVVGGIIVLAIVTSASAGSNATRTSASAPGDTSSGNSPGASSTTNACQTQKAALRSQADNLDSQIASSKSWLDSEQSALTSEKSQLDATSANIDQTNARLRGGAYWPTAAAAQQYQDYVNQYNQAVIAHNQRLGTYRSRVADYNSMIDQRNSLATQYNGISC
jgi:hypothetical protein